MIPGQRLILAGLMDWLVADTAAVHYAGRRPMGTRGMESIVALAAALRSPGGLTTDCSETVTLLLKLAGCSDPNGLNFNGAGNTETLLDHLTHYERPGRANIGALVVFDPAVKHGAVLGRHVCMVRKPGPDPVLFSHGQERDPVYVKLSNERVGGTEPYVLLDVSKL